MITNALMFLLIIVVIISAIKVLPYCKSKPKPSQSRSERIKYYEHMRHLGIKEWEIDLQFKNISSLRELKLINKNLKYSIAKYNL